MRMTHLGLLLVPLLAACPDNSDECAPRVATSDVECTTTQQCVDEGFNTLACLNGLCQRACFADEDCVIGRDLVDDACATTGEQQPETPYCEAQICRTGCPTVACGAGESCFGGRCVYDYEGFEIPEGSDFVDLPSLGFVAEDAELENRTIQIAQLGRANCALGDEMCAGVASRGERFAVVGTTPTRARGTAGETPPTCRACACCLDCVINPPVVGENAEIPFCPGAPGRLWSLPQSLVCPATPPAECTTVCNACDQCPAAELPSGDRLTTCEARAAAKGCSKCIACNVAIAGCRSSMCASECSGSDQDSCVACVRTKCFTSQECIDCEVCSQAAECELAGAGTAECAMRRAACDTLGADGCYGTPAHYPRAGLTESEQSLTSRPIDLSSAGGTVVLQLEYVPFNVGVTYKAGIEGQDPTTWPTAPQQVLVELCASDCGNPGNWLSALDAAGAVAMFPPASVRSNQLTLGSQSEIEWRNGRIEVLVPAMLWTPSFRYRIRPQLADGARVGIDNIYVRALR